MLNFQGVGETIDGWFIMLSDDEAGAQRSKGHLPREPAEAKGLQ